MGVRFVVRSREASAGPEATYEFDQSRVVIGRGHGADVRLPHPTVSQTHAVVKQQDVGYVLIDEGSTNGTYVGGRPVVQGRPKPLRDGDRIVVGAFELELRSGVAVASGTSAERTTALARQLVRELWAAGPDPVPPARLSVVEGPDTGRRLELPAGGDRWVVGRGEECDLPLADADVSREHLAIERRDGGLFAVDLGSKNGIEVNGRSVRERILRDRDEARLGATVLVLEDPADARLSALEEEPDAPLPPPEPPSVQAGSASPDATADGEGAAPPSPEPARPPPRARSAAGTDVVIYVLAGSIFLLSLAGLVLLLR